MKPIRDATVVIGLVDNGAVAAELSAALVETLKTLRELADDRPGNKHKGSVKLDLSIVVEGDSVRITGDVKAKTPDPVRAASFFWTLPDGSLSVEHPNQLDIFKPRAAGGSTVVDGEIVDEDGVIQEGAAC